MNKLTAKQMLERYIEWHKQSHVIDWVGHISRPSNNGTALWKQLDMPIKYLSIEWREAQGL